MSTWQPLLLPQSFYAMWEGEYGKEVPAPKAFGCGELRALVGREPVAKGDQRWHLSVSRPDTLPTWRDMVNAAHGLRPGVVFVIGVPPRSWWMNVHPYTLHMWEVRDPHLTAQWKHERRGDTPT